MHHHYNDIRARIDVEPRWFDEHAVPRYCNFSPDESANIYAEECCLAEIACQNCGRRFQVCFTWDTASALRQWMLAHDNGEQMTKGDAKKMSLIGLVLASTFHFH